MGFGRLLDDAGLLFELIEALGAFRVVVPACN